MKKSDVLMIATAAAIGLTALTATYASAKERGFGDRISFEELDANADGLITADDLEALRDQRFADLDTDGDGSVSRAEFEAASAARASERAGQMFDRLDADGDGVLSRDAVEGQSRGPSARMVERLDADGDGGVSAEEFEAAQARMDERRGGRFGGRHDGSRNR